MNVFGRLAVSILLCCLVIFAVTVVGDEDEQGQRPTLLERLTGMFLSSSSSPAAAASPGYLDKIKRMVNQLHAYFFPPNLDFRGGEEVEGHWDDGKCRAGEKMKAAVSKSLENSKAAVEDSAEFAATIASETMQKTKEKVKRSLTDSGREAEPDETKSEL